MSPITDGGSMHETSTADLDWTPLAGFDPIALLTGDASKLRRFILDLAARGRIVRAEIADGTADDLLKQVEVERPPTTKRLKPLEPVSAEHAPFPIPTAWRWTRLGDICNYGTCEKAGTLTNETWVLDLEDVEKDSGSILQWKTFLERRSESDKNVFRKGDVLYGKLRPYLNKVAVADRDGVCTTEILPLRVYGGISAKYVQLALRSTYFLEYVNSKSYGMKMPRLGTADGRHAPFPLPPLAEQHRIVVRVEELMKLCDALEENGRLADEQHARLVSTLFDALAGSESAYALGEHWRRVAEHFDLLLDRTEAIDVLEQTVLQLAVRGLLVAQDPQEEAASYLMAHIQKERSVLFGSGLAKRGRELIPVREDEKAFVLPTKWTWARFDDLVRADKPVAYGVLVPGPDVPDGIPFVRLGDLSLDSSEALPEKAISSEIDAQFTRTRLEGGEILLGVVGSIGKLGIAPSTWKGANIARAVSRIVPTSLVDKIFVLTLLQSRFMRERFVSDTRTLAQPTLNIGLIRECPTPLPPLAEQRRIVARVEELRRLCADLRGKLTEARKVQSALTDALVAKALRTQSQQQPTSNI